MDDLYNNDDLFDVLETHLPENLPDSSVAALCGFLISTFSGTLPEAMAVVRQLTAQLAENSGYRSTLPLGRVWWVERPRIGQAVHVVRRIKVLPQ